jgi:hypothetical protein
MARTAHDQARGIKDAQEAHAVLLAYRHWLLPAMANS